MTPAMSWAAIGLGLLVLYLLVFRPWPGEVRERGPKVRPVKAQGTSLEHRELIVPASRSLTSLYDQETDEWGGEAA